MSYMSGAEMLVTYGLAAAWDPVTMTTRDFLEEQARKWGTDWPAFELLKHGSLVRPYFDCDQGMDRPPTQAQITSVRQQCVDALHDIFGTDPNVPFSLEENVKVGYRHGQLPNGKYKISFRFWVRGWCILMEDMKTLIVELSQANHPWDTSVYSNGRKMGVPGGCKGGADQRTLELEDRDRPELAIIQYLEGGEERLHFSTHARTERVSQGKIPEDWGVIEPLLVAGGFHDPYPVGSRSKSITFRSADIGDQCPLCPHTHDHQNYWIMQCEDGRLRVKSYSDRCSSTMFGEAKYLFGANDGVEQMALVPSQPQALSHSLDDAMYDAVGAHLDPMSVVQKKYGFNFKTVGNTIPCKLCNNVHAEQEYECHTLVLPACQVISPFRGCETIVGYKQAPVLERLVRNPHESTAFAEMFAMQQLYHGIRWVHSGQQWYRFDGSLWRPVIFPDLSKALCAVATDALTTLALFVDKQESLGRADMASEIPASKVKEWGKSLWKARAYVQNISGLKNIIETAQNNTMYDPDFAGQLDRNRDVVGAPNGVICLKTGELRQGEADQYVSKQVGAVYHGLDYPTPDIDAFFLDVFNGDRAVVAYLQRYMGYFLTGHTMLQTFAIFWGTGSNSKSVLADMLRLTFGEYFRNMARDCLFASDRKSSTNAATPHLAELDKVRLGVVEESKDTDVLDTALIKQVTGSSQLNCRMLHQNNQVIDVTHKPLLLTNFKPRIDVEDPAWLRRILVVPFLNVYKTQTEMDPRNPHHRLMDPHLKDKLLTPPVLSQFLTWLVQGAKDWYEAGLCDKPKLMVDAEQKYIGENDFLATFIAEHCEQGADYKVEAKQFREAFESATDSRIKADACIKKMVSRGFTHRKKRFTPNSNPTSAFLGLRLML